MDSNDDDLFEDDGPVFDDPTDLPTDDLPTDADSLHSLVRNLTAYILELEWGAAIYESYASGALHHACTRRAQAMKGLGTPAENDAIEAGRQQFANGFTSEEARRIFLSGTSREWDILQTEAKLRYLNSLPEDAPNGNAPLV